MPTPSASPTRRSNPTRSAKAPPRTPEELLDRIEDRARRRIAGGVLSLHRRGRGSLGAAWLPLAAAGTGLSIFGAWRLVCRIVPALRGLSRLRPRRSPSLFGLFGLLRR